MCSEIGGTDDSNRLLYKRISLDDNERECTRSCTKEIVILHDLNSSNKFNENYCTLSE